MAADRLPPGEFVSPELQSECARFLADVKSMVNRRNDPRSRVIGAPDERER